MGIAQKWLASRYNRPGFKELQRHFGFEPDRVAAAAKELLGRS